MITNLLEAIVYQLLFLMFYELFLRRETFFIRNRFYLLCTSILAILLPWIKIDFLNGVVPQSSPLNTVYFRQLNEVILTASGPKSTVFEVPWLTVVYLLGVAISLILFCRKIGTILKYKNKGKIEIANDYYRVKVSGSTEAFSFLNLLFIGEKIDAKVYDQVVAHEEVHIRQRHSLDHLYFELLRIIMWFNPLIYLYQSRISEIHEFIADNNIQSIDKNRQIDLLLSHAFGSNKISFINQFFQSSLIKKRIVMLKKAKTPSVRRFKFLLVTPLLILMLGYNSCKDEYADSQENFLKVSALEKLTAEEEQEIFANVMALSQNEGRWEYTVSDGISTLRFIEGDGSSYLSGPGGEQIPARMIIEGNASSNMENIFGVDSGPVPFAEVETAPIFPGCEEAEDTRTCFNERMMTHIRKNFNYPKEAIEQGLEGRVALMFTIDENGIVTDVRSKGPHQILEAEAERIINKLPGMLAGKKGDQAVKVNYSIPITFQLN